MERRGWIAKSLVIGLAAITIFSLFSHASYMEANEVGTVTLSVTAVSLGDMKKDPTDPRGRRGYFECIDGFPVVFQGYGRSKHAWEVQIYAEDFRNEYGDTIPVSRLRWRRPQDVYRLMPGVGSYDRLAASSDYNGNHRWERHQIPLSFYLSLTGDEYAGNYQSTVYVSIVSY